MATADRISIIRTQIHISISMILPVFTLVLQPSNPLHFSLEKLRIFFTAESARHTSPDPQLSAARIHRYPVIQCKQVKNRLLVIGISQGADLLHALSHGRRELLMDENTCTILQQDQGIRHEVIRISDTIHRYEFLTPWLALNQQNAKKFYDLKGKPERDAFMQKILTGHISTFSKSIDFDLTAPLMCRSRVRFRRERVQDENVMVFLGTFETNLRIPDYFGIGLSVSSGFGTIRSMDEDAGTIP